MFIFFYAFVHLAVMQKDEKDFIAGFGKRVKELRIERHLSQEMLANDADIPINQIGRIERAEISTSLSTIYKIAKALEVNPIVLFGSTAK